MVSIICHGGASSFTEEELLDIEANNSQHVVLSGVRKAIAKGLVEATNAGMKVLQAGGSSEQAVEITTRILEDNELFNETSWLAVMHGQGLTPRGYHPLVDALAEGEIERRLQHIYTVIQKSVATMPMQKDFIAKYCKA